MNIDGQPYRTIFPDPDGVSVQVIDQTRLPFAFELKRLATLEDAAVAIRTMIVRGAPLIGVTAAYGLALAMRADASHDGIDRAVATLAATRPTAINLRWALDRVSTNLRQVAPDERFAPRLRGGPAASPRRTWRAAAPSAPMAARSSPTCTGPRAATDRSPC